MTPLALVRFAAQVLLGFGLSMLFRFQYLSLHFIVVLFCISVLICSIVISVQARSEIQRLSALVESQKVNATLSPPKGQTTFKFDATCAAKNVLIENKLLVSKPGSTLNNVSKALDKVRTVPSALKPQVAPQQQKGSDKLTVPHHIEVNMVSAPAEIPSSRLLQNEFLTFYVGNLSYRATTSSLKQHVEKVLSIKVDQVVIACSSDGKSRGCAFVTLRWPKYVSRERLSSMDCVNKVCAKVSSSTLFGRRPVFQLARSQRRSRI
jgi:hypothetical protein